MVPRTLEEQVPWLDEHSGGHPAVVAESTASSRRLRLALAVPAPAGVRHDGRGLGLRPAGYQGRGIGRPLLDELVRLAAAHGFHSVIARIIGGNDASIALHAACGFEVVGTEREVGRKFGRWLDVVVMQRML